MRCSLMLKIEKHDQVQTDQTSQLGRSLIHEHAAPMSGRADRVRRNKQHRQLVGIRRQAMEAIAVISPKRSSKDLCIINRGKSSGTPASTKRLLNVNQCATQSIE